MPLRPIPQPLATLWEKYKVTAVKEWPQAHTILKPSGLWLLQSMVDPISFKGPKPYFSPQPWKLFIAYHPGYLAVDKNKLMKLQKPTIRNKALKLLSMSAASVAERKLTFQINCLSLAFHLIKFQSKTSSFYTDATWSVNFLKLILRCLANAGFILAKYQRVFQRVLQTRRFSKTKICCYSRWSK